MPKVTLTINGEENYETNHPLITIGRTADNNVSIPNDTNISRYHARIEQREDGFWFVDQGSSNGSSVNGNDVESEMLLESGDEILLGGTSRILFETDEGTEEDSDDESSELSESTESTAAPQSQENRGSSTMMLLAGTAVGLALISVAVAGVVFWKTGESKCEASARIISPRSGEVLTEVTEVRVEITNSQCVQKAVFMLDGKEIGSSENEPFSISVDPAQYPELANGGTYNLKVVLVDTRGERLIEPNGIYLGFETLEDVKPPTPEPMDTPFTKPETGGGTKAKADGKTVSPIEAKELGEKLIAARLGGNRWRLDPQFWNEVSKRLPEYVSEGYYSRAYKYYESINVKYVIEQNLDASLGYILAMSRSKFNPAPQGADVGLWRMSNEFVTTNGFTAACGTETISDPSQDCAAKASSVYLSNVYMTVFNGDIIYTVAAFGMSPQEAAQWRASLPEDTRDFWKILSPKQKDEVVRFFAAGIVTENPQRFGLKKDRPLSDLYKITLGN